MVKLQSLVCFTPSLSAKISRAFCATSFGGGLANEKVTVAPVAVAATVGTTSASLMSSLMELVTTVVSRFSMPTSIFGSTVVVVEPPAGDSAATVARWTPASATGTRTR